MCSLSSFNPPLDGNAGLFWHATLLDYPSTVTSSFRVTPLLCSRAPAHQGKCRLTCRTCVLKACHDSKTTRPGSCLPSCKNNCYTGSVNTRLQRTAGCFLIKALSASAHTFLRYFAHTWTGKTNAAFHMSSSCGGCDKFTLFLHGREGRD